MSYTSLEDLRDQVGVTGSSDDDRLLRALAAATEAIDNFCGRTFGEVDPDADGAKSTRRFTAASARLVLVDDVVKVDEVEQRLSPTGDFETVDASDYEAAPVNAAADGKPYTRLRRLTAWWPEHEASVRVTGWFGWLETPDTVKQAEILQASRLFRRGEAPLGISQVPGMDGGGGMRLLAKLDADVELMLTQLRRTKARTG